MFNSAALGTYDGWKPVLVLLTDRLLSPATSVVSQFVCHSCAAFVTPKVPGMIADEPDLRAVLMVCQSSFSTSPLHPFRELRTLFFIAWISVTGFHLRGRADLSHHLGHDCSLAPKWLQVGKQITRLSGPVFKAWIFSAPPDKAEVAFLGAQRKWSLGPSPISRRRISFSFLVSLIVTLNGYSPCLCQGGPRPPCLCLY
jgi:hypothetical protein